MAPVTAFQSTRTCVEVLFVQEAAAVTFVGIDGVFAHVAGVLGIDLIWLFIQLEEAEVFPEQLFTDWILH